MDRNRHLEGARSACVRLAVGLLVAVLADGAVLGSETAIAGGDSFGIALDSDTSVWAWGGNANGAVGDGTATDRLTPLPVRGVGGSGHLTGITAIAAGQGHVLALTASGTVVAWGQGSSGQLGDGASVDRFLPVVVQMSGGGALTGIVAIAAGTNHSLAVRNDGTVWAWGDNALNQIGSAGIGTRALLPVQIAGPGGVGVLTGITAVAGGAGFSLALRADGTVWAWGDDSSGQLGKGFSSGTSPFPTQVQDGGGGPLSGITAIAAGASHGVALKNDQTVHAWGGNTVNQLGIGAASTAVTSARLVQTAAGVGLGGIDGIAARGSFTLAHATNSTAWTWGDDNWGQQGIGSFGTSPYAVQVRQAAGGAVLTGVSGIGIGPRQSYFLMGGANVLACGHDGSGQLGVGFAALGGTPSLTSPVVTAAFGPIVASACGQYMSGALKRDGTVWTWGYDYYGQLGDGATLPGANRYAPAKVASLSDIVALSAGGDFGDHFLALRRDGTVWAWGRNTNGQLGNNTQTSSSTPVKVLDPGDVTGFLTNVVAISAGDEFSLALKRDGTVRAWGLNSSGQCGLNSTLPANQLVPATVLNTTGTAALSGIVALSGGNAFSLALGSDGSVYAWGSNSLGQLGRSGLSLSALPLRVSMPLAWSVCAGSYHALAVDSTGLVWAWGSDTHGQVSMSAASPQTTPISVAGFGGRRILKCGAGDYHSLAQASDGTMWGWGWNVYGELGNGTTTDTGTLSPPVQVTGIANAVQLEAGYIISQAVLADGTLRMWGYNGQGQLGDNYAEASTSTPVSPTANWLPSITVALIANAIEPATPGTFKLSRTLNADFPLTVGFTTGGTAVGGSDYVALSGSATFPAGADTTTVSVVPISDYVDQGTRTILLGASPASSYLVGSPATATMTLTDDRTAGMTVTPVGPLSGGQLVTSKSGQSATFTIVLNSQPAMGVVTVSFAPTNANQATVSPSVSFDTTFGGPTSWNTPRTITVTGIDDGIDEGDVAYGVTVQATGSDPKYQIAAPNVPAINLNNHVAGVVLTPFGGFYGSGVNVLAMAEANGTATFQVQLNSKPTSSVSMSVSSSNVATAIVSPPSLTFDGTNWNTPQTVTVTGVPDDIADGDIASVLSVSAPSSLDPKYSRHAALTAAQGQTVFATTIPFAPFTANASSPRDWQVAKNGVAIAPVSGFTVAASANGTAQITLASGAALNDAITVDYVPEDAFIAAAGQTTFTSSQPFRYQSGANWSVLVNGVALAPTAYSVAPTTVGQFPNIAQLTLGSPPAPGATVQVQYEKTIAAETIDDDVRGVVISPLAVNVVEGGATDAYTVNLSSQPTGSGSVTVTLGTTSEVATDKTVLTFTATTGQAVSGTTSGWNIPQTVTVSAPVDHNVQGVHQVPITHTVSAAGTDYASVASGPTVQVTIHDTDVAGVVASPSGGLFTTEAGGTARFTVALTARPTANVTLDVVSSDPANGGKPPGYPTTYTLTFTPTDGQAVSGQTSGWNVAQTVTITGSRGSVGVTGNTAYTIRLQNITSTDGNYNALPTSLVGVTNTDIDVPGLTVTESNGSTVVAEGGATDSYTVVLNTLPSSLVVVEVNPDQNVTVNPSYLVFDGTTWNVPQTVTVTGVEDFIARGSHTGVITNVAHSSDAAYDGTGGAAALNRTVNVTVTDTNVAGLALTPATGLATLETGGTANLSVRLRSRPQAASVTVDLYSSNPAHGTIPLNYDKGATGSNNRLRLTFTNVTDQALSGTTSGWNVAQTVTATGVHDFIDTGNLLYAIVAEETSADAKYSTTQSFTGDGSTTAFTSGMPYVTNNGSNWHAYVGGVAVAAGAFQVSNAGGLAQLTLTTAPANGAAVALLYVPFALVTSIDTDIAGIQVTPTTGLTTAEGGSTTCTVVLTSQPTADVLIDLSSSNPGKGTIPLNFDKGATGSNNRLRLTFTPTRDQALAGTTSGWNVAQTVTISGVSDDVMEGPVPYLVLADGAVSADAKYTGMRAPTVHVTALDDDVAGFSLTRLGPYIDPANPATSPLKTMEDPTGAPARFQLVLTSQPTGNVTIPLSSTNTGKGVVSPASVTFTPSKNQVQVGSTSGWNVPQTITVSGVDNLIADGDVAYQVLTGLAISTDPNYNGHKPPNVDLVTIDNDVAGFAITPIGPLVPATTTLQTTDLGASATFRVALTSQPTGTVNVTLASSDPVHGSVSPTTLTFTTATGAAGGWNVPQTVTVTGANGNNTNDGNVAYSVTFAPALSSDATYNGMVAAPVAALNVHANHPPTLNSIGMVTINENAPATVVSLTGITTGLSGEVQNLVVTAISDNPSVVPNPLVTYTSPNASGSLTITPVAMTNGSAQITVTVSDDGGTANGGSNTVQRTFQVLVQPVNQPPSFTKGVDVTVLEDAGAQTIAGWATAISPGPANENTQGVSLICSTNNDALFAVAPAVGTNSGSGAPPYTGGLTFTPGLHTSGTATVSVYARDTGGTANGGNDTSLVQTFTITVTPVNHPPTFTPGANQTVAENAPAQTVPGWATAISPGPPNEVAQTVSFACTNDNNALFAVQPSIDASGTLRYMPQTYQSGVATVTVIAKDNGGTANGGNDTAAAITFTITVTFVNQLPTVLVNSGLTVPRGGSGTITAAMLQATDIETPSPSLVFTAQLLPGSGSLTRSGVALGVLGTFTQADITNGLIAYVNDASPANSDGFAFTITDGNGGVSAPTVFHIVVTGYNPPVVTLTPGAISYTERAPPILVDGGATVTDVDSANFSGGRLTVDYASGGTVDDLLTILNQGVAAGQIGISGNTVTYAGAVLGTWSGGVGTTPLVVTLTSLATPPVTAALINCVQFSNASHHPVGGDRSVRFVVRDNTATDSAAVMRTVTLIPVNEPPTITAVPVLTANGVALTVTVPVDDPDLDPLTMSVAVPPVKGAVSALTTTVAATPGTASFLYTPIPGQSGADSVVLTATDPGGLSTTQTIPVVITGGGSKRPWIVSDPPVEIDQGGSLATRIDVAMDDYTGSLVAPPTLTYSLVGNLTGVTTTFSPSATLPVGTSPTLGITIAPTMSGYVQFGILVTDTVNQLVGYQPVTIHIVPAGGGGG